MFYVQCLLVISVNFITIPTFMTVLKDNHSTRMNELFAKVNWCRLYRLFVIFLVHVSIYEMNYVVLKIG